VSRSKRKERKKKRSLHQVGPRGLFRAPLLRGRRRRKGAFKKEELPSVMGPTPPRASRLEEEIDEIRSRSKAALPPLRKDPASHADDSGHLRASHSGEHLLGSDLFMREKEGGDIKLGT